MPLLWEVSCVAFKKSSLNSCEVYKNLLKLKIYVWYSLDSLLLFGIDNLLYITILQRFNWFVDCQSVLHHCYTCVDLCKLKRMIVSTVHLFSFDMGRTAKQIEQSFANCTMCITQWTSFNWVWTRIKTDWKFFTWYDSLQISLDKRKSSLTVW